MDGVDKVLLSGTGAFVIVKDDTKLTSESVGKAFAPTGLTLEGVATKEIAHPKEAFQLAVTGGT